jgi:acetolactate synthase I/II/III large subunit
VTSTMSGSRVFAEMMMGYSVSHLFFVTAILTESMAEMEDLGITRVVTHGEKAAAYMADGYARAGHRPGVCLAQNVGAANLAAGIRDAAMACSPVIAITGGEEAGSRYRHAYQEVEDFPMFAPVTKFGARVDTVSRLPDLVRQTFRESTTGAPGPVHLRIAGNEGQLLKQQTSMPALVELQFACYPPYRPAAEERSIERALDLLRRAERPVIVAGGGVVASSAGANLVALAEKLSIPVATSLNAKEVIVDRHPLAVGVVGSYSRECANRAVSEADVVFFVGSHTGGQVTNNWKVPPSPAAVIQLDIDPVEIGRNYPVDVGLVGDAQISLQRMLEMANSGVVHSAWLDRVRILVEEWRQRAAPLLRSNAVPIRPERLCKAISDTLPNDGVLVSDTGHAGMWTGAMVELSSPRQRYLRCAGSLGWAFPAALGAKCALPDQTVVAFNGDGGFLYHVAELETAARYGINAVIVVNNNHAYNQQKRLFDSAYGGQQRGRAHDMWVFKELNFARVAEEFGCLGLRVERPEELEGVLQSAYAAGRPAVVDVVTDIEAAAERGWVPG